MNLAITEGFQHFQLTYEEDDVAVSTLQLDLGFGSMVFPFLIKVSSLFWRIGSDLKPVDMGIKVLQLMFRSCVHMKWLPFFCFIYVFVGLGEKHRLGFQGKTGRFWLFGDWVREYCGYVKVFVKHRVASRSGPAEEGKDDGAGVRSLVSLVSRGTERTRHSVALSNRTCSNNMNRRQGSRSGVLSSPTLEPSTLFRRALSCFPRVFRAEVKASVLGLLLFPSEAQKSPCQLPISTPSPCYEPTNTPLKRVAKAQGKKPQNCNMQAQEFRWAFGFMGEGGCIVVCFLLVVCWLSLMYLFHMNE